MKSYLSIQRTTAVADQTVIRLDSFVESKEYILVMINNSFVDSLGYELHDNSDLEFSNTFTAGDNVIIVKIANIEEANVNDIDESADEDLYETGIMGNQVRTGTITGRCIADGAITSNHMDITSSEVGLVTRILAGENMSITSSGSESGTGVVTISTDAASELNSIKNLAGYDFYGIKTFNDGIKIGEVTLLPYDTLPTLYGNDIAAFDGYLGATRVYNAVFNDIAECMPSDGTLKPGDIAVVSTKSTEFELTKFDLIEHYSDQVIGIVSENPGMIVGENPEYKNKIYIALKGMVPISQELMSTIPQVGDKLYLIDDGGIYSGRELTTASRQSLTMFNCKEIGTVIKSNAEEIKVFV